MSPQLESALGALRAAIRAGRNDVRLLVPTATLAEHRRHQLAREGLVFRPELIQTLARFAADLAPEVRQVSEPLFLIAVERALSSLRLAEFAGVSDAPGFAASVSGAIQRLDSVGLRARDLERICGEWPYAGPLARIWEAAESKLWEHRFTLRTGVLRAAAGKHEGGLLLDGFAKFSAPELQFLRIRPAAQPEAEFAGVTERFAADSDVREAEEIARRILDAGVPFREIGIALRNPERYVGVLRPVLERFGIPARFYFSEPLSRSAVCRLFAGTVEAFLTGWDHEVLLPVLRLGPGHGSGRQDRLDFAVREQVPNSGLAALRQLGAGFLVDEWEILGRNWARHLTPERWAEQIAVDLRRVYRLRDGSAAPVRFFEAALREAAAVDSAAVSLAEFWATARTVIENTALRLPDKRRNVIHVMSVYEARQWTLDTVFICGLAEKAFPKRHPQDAFLPDAAMEKLKRAGFGVQTSADLDAEEQDLFRLVCASARRQVVLSYAAEQKDGPSVFWGEVSGAAPAPEPVRPALPARGTARFNSAQVVDPALIAWIAKKQPAFSVTALENYLGCPFKYLAVNLLRMKTAPLRPEKRLSFLQEGIIVHEVLEKWLPRRGPIRPVLDQVFERICGEKRVARGYRSEHSYAQMLGNLERFARTAWPRNEALPPEQDMEFAITDGIAIKARIDRMERAPDGRLVIIDYKYSNAVNTQGKVGDDTKLQGPLYVRGMEGRGQPVAAMVYFSLKKSAEAFGWGEVPGFAKELEPLTREWVEHGVSEARVAVDSIRAGSFPVRSQLDDFCKFCDAKDACRVELLH